MIRLTTCGALALCLLILGEAAVQAQTSEAWHFLGDTSRHARVDDRGGLGEGFSFSIEYDPNDGNSEDFCPHCRFSVMVSDPGVSLDELERLGVHRSDIQSSEGLLGTLQGLLTSPPAELAHQLVPALDGEDLANFIAEITVILAKVDTAVTRLTSLASLQALTFDWTTASLDDVIAALGLQQDSGFLASFSDHNDPRIENSGVSVYTLANLITGMAAKQVPENVRNAIQSSLSAIPGLNGPFELSGDDDDVTRPVRYHGYHTNLTVQQRTYAIDGFSAYLVVFTLVNDTSRVLPFVEVAMIADFDIPPLSYDSDTDFDPLTSAVRVHDVIPYVDPEQHYWFGLAPAAIGAPTPGSFFLANWNIDKNMSLAQSAPSINDNRYRFFLWDPSVSGDHDDADGKSEKQGAVSMLLEGPLLPGDQRSVAFCYTAGEGGSSDAASVEMLALMESCRGMYTLLTPNCGDGIIEYGEECEPALTDHCSEQCESEACGDRKVNGQEECDDGNTEDADGCSATCVNEVCGNGVVQAGEECDDGNASNADGCLTTCMRATCGDGVLRDCNGQPGPECGGCAGYGICLLGTATLETLSTQGGTLESLRDAEVQFLVAFDTTATDIIDSADGQGTRITTGPVHVEMSGNVFAASQLAPALEGATWVIDTVSGAPPGGPGFSTTALTGLVGTQTVSFNLSALPPGVDFEGDAFLGLPRIDTVRLLDATATITAGAETAGGTALGSFHAVQPGEGSELCDDGNASDFDACTSACVLATCGDGLLQQSEGEQCDEGGSPPAWCVNCQRANLASCGDGVVSAAAGEICDDGNTADGDGCSALCLRERCGDGVVQGSEECDDGGNGNGDGCTDVCALERCGDGVIQSSEECDSGDGLSDTAACLPTCRDASCGDGLVQEGVEECDDGNGVDGDGCGSGCVSERCGDGRPGPGEQCDDGNAAAGDGCAPDCAVEFCGDQHPGPGEQCDDGNAAAGDGCNKDCLLEHPEACGDGHTGTGEQCDDGGTTDGDGCNQFCQLEDPAACGDGAADPGEGCDDGNTVNGDGCSVSCTVERCGDGVHATGEACDDGDEDSGDGCSNVCAAEPSTCGNGEQEYGEECDDGNTIDDDGCSADCEVPSGPAPETCGNGQQDRGEECDDGGREDGNGCDEVCQLEAVVCGNGRLDYGETCDDQNTTSGDECGDQCLLENPLPRPEPEPEGDDGCGACGSGKSGGTHAALLVGGLVWALRRRRRLPRS